MVGCCFLLLFVWLVVVFLFLFGWLLFFVSVCLVVVFCFCLFGCCFFVFVLWTFPKEIEHNPYTLKSTTAGI